MKISIVIPTFNRNDKLKRCIESVLNSTYKEIEIIIIDNSIAGTVQKIEKLFLRNDIIFHYNYKNLGASGARTLGAQKASGDWILFIDDDNVLNKDCINELIKVIEKDNMIGALSPIMYYLQQKDKIWFAGAFFNFFTSKASFLKEPKNQDFYECDMIHNVYLIKKELGDSLGWQDLGMFMGYEEFDLFMRIKKKGYKIGIARNAIEFHDHPLKESIIRLINTPEKAYFTIKNRMIIIKRYSSILQLIIFTLVFYPFFIMVYAFFIIKEKRFDLLKYHFSGALAGYKYLFN